MNGLNVFYILCAGLLGLICGIVIMALISANSYDKGYEDGKRRAMHEHRNKE